MTIKYKSLFIYKLTLIKSNQKVKHNNYIDIYPKQQVKLFSNFIVFFHFYEKSKLTFPSKMGKKLNLIKQKLSDILVAQQKEAKEKFIIRRILRISWIYQLFSFQFCQVQQ